MADDLLSAAAIGVLDGIQKGIQPFLEQRIKSKANREDLLLQQQLYKERLPLDTASKIAIEQAKPPTYYKNVQSGETLPPNTKPFNTPSNKPPAPTPGENAKAKIDAKVLLEKPKAFGSLKETIKNYDSMIREAQEISSDPNLNTGIIGKRVSQIEGTKSYGVAKRIDTLKAKTLLNVLGSLKQLSQTGASGFGQLSDKEGKALEDSISTLDTGQSIDDFKKSIQRFIKSVSESKSNLINTFNDTYGGGFSDMKQGAHETDKGNPLAEPGFGDNGKPLPTPTPSQNSFREVNVGGKIFRLRKKQ